MSRKKAKRRLYTRRRRGEARYHHLRESQRHEIDLARLRLELSRVDADAYRARLDPDFLFGAFRKIGNLMDQDVPRARSALADLSELMRESLGRNGDR
jgi:LytS/YehU family sensor histidine kinase